MRIISWNVNGIRACVRKGFLEYLRAEAPDICCIQETKALETDLEETVLNPSGYYGIWHSAERRGYSGVAIFTKPKPINVIEGFGIPKFDCEGRVLMADYGQFILLNVYFPNGQKDDARLAYKLDFYDKFFEYCNDLKSGGRHLIICGDYNIAHKPIDLARPKENENYSGFLPIERDWLDRMIAYGYVDTFRHFCAEPHQYTWWSYRAGARAKNIGWRIDYFFVNREFLPYISGAFIQPQVMGSDHCPLEIQFLVNDLWRDGDNQFRL